MSPTTIVAETGASEPTTLVEKPMSSTSSNTIASGRSQKQHHVRKITEDFDADNDDKPKQIMSAGHSINSQQIGLGDSAAKAFLEFAVQSIPLILPSVLYFMQKIFIFHALGCLS